MIRLQDATVSLGGEEIFAGVGVHVLEGDKVGVVGRNGSGKTTLLRALEGELPLDSGTREARSRIRVASLPQHVVANSARSVWEESRSGMTRLLEVRAALDNAEGALHSGDARAIQRYEEARAAFDVAGGGKADELVGRVLTGLGFKTEDWARPCRELSGGWQMRVALARLLLSEPDVALLDEPTNHLDLLARSWLTDFLREVPYAIVVVSHDRHLLEVAIDRVLELRGGKVHAYKGRYSQFLVQRDERLAQLRKSAAAVQEERARLQGFVDRFGAKATKAAQARSRKKMLDRLEDVEVEGLEAKPSFRLPEPPSGHAEVLVLDQVTVGWTEEAVLSDVTLRLHRGERVALIGRNGSGKSTLLAAVAARIRPSRGKIVRGDGFRLGEFRQDLVSSLPQDRPALEHLQTQVPMVPPERIRAVLGALGLRGGDAFRKIGELSGGERARVALTLLAVQPASLLVLDEPTNHLDIETVDVLAQALAQFGGALLFTAHDRWFVERIATHVARIDDGRLDVRIGIRSEDFLFEADGVERASRERSSQAKDYDQRRQSRRDVARLERAVERLHQEIADREQSIQQVDEALVEAASDHVRARQLALERESLAVALATLYETWERTEAELEIAKATA